MLELPTAQWSAYRSRLRDEFAAGWLSGKQYLALVAIADLNAGGDWEPTVAKIAAYAGCDERTVRRARARAQGRGLLAVRAQFDGEGWQRSNHYELTVPSTPCRPKPKVSRGGQTDRPSQSKEVRKRLGKGDVGETVSLAARAKAVEARLRADYVMRRLL